MFTVRERLLFVNVVWVEGLFFGEGEGCWVGAGFEVYFAVETGVSACVACACALLIDVKDECVLIAVCADFDDFLGVA